MSFDSAKVQSDYPIDKNKKIRFKSDEPKSSETPENTGKRKNKKNPIKFSEKLNRMVSIGYYWKNLRTDIVIDPLCKRLLLAHTYIFSQRRRILSVDIK